MERLSESVQRDDQSRAILTTAEIFWPLMKLTGPKERFEAEAVTVTVIVVPRGVSCVTVGEIRMV